MPLPITDALQGSQVRPDANKGAQALRPQRPHYGSVGAAGLSIPSTCYACANVSVCVSRSAALNHLSACRDKAASSSRRDAPRRAHKMQAGSIVSVRWRCPRQRRTLPKSAFCDGHHAFLDTGGVGRARCRTTCRRVGAATTSRPALPRSDLASRRATSTRSTIASSHSSGAVPIRGPDQCEDGVGTRSHKWPWRRARALDGGPSMIMTSIGEVYNFERGH
jgi:hypothetical protein